MATYQEIDHYIRTRFGYVPKPCWIAHVKAAYGLNRGRFSGAAIDDRKVKCPPEKWYDVEAALMHFGMIQQRR